jgi:PAS domain S-box-containing protein
LSGKDSRSDHAAKLRRQAEELFQDNTAKSSKHVEALSPEETQHMLHELQVHQIELEMQNEELRQAQVELDTGRARYFDLYDLAPVGYVTISEQGLLLEANLTTATLLGVTRNDLIKQPFSRFVLREDQDTCYFLNKQLFETGEPHGCELRMVKKDGTAFWVRLQATSVQNAAGPAVSRVVISDITERKQAEEDLKKRNLFVESLLENAPIGFAVNTISDGQRVFVSRNFEKIYGVEPDSMQCVSDYFEKVYLDPVFREKMRERIMADMATGETARMSWEDIPITTHAGERRVVTAVNIPLPDQNLMISTVQDVTERKQAEEALLQARDDWESTFDSLTDAVTIHDKNYDIIRANSSARQMLGLPLLGNLITKAKCFMCYHGTEKPPEGCPSCRSLVTEQPSSYELFEPHLNKYLEIRAIPRFDTHHQCIGLVHVVRDITERKRAEEEIQRERAFFDRLVESAPEGIAITDTQGKVLRVNAEFVRMFGYELDEAVGQCLDDLVAPPTRQEEARAITRSTNQGEKTLLETVRRRKDGTLVDVSLIGAPILVAGKLEAGYGIYRDITERKQAEDQLRQSQKMEAIGQLAGGVAHDFNNLLTGILGNIALIRGGLPAADPLLENLNAAETAARQAADLTKGLLTFGRSAMVLPVSMNITTALDATLALLKQSLPATMEIVRDYEQTAWNVLVDQSQMTQILLNLAVNARDAMKGKGILTIRTSNEVVGEKYVQTHPFARTGEFVHLSVTDTGPGMSSEVMQHLFEPFYTTKPIGSGTGLGLSIVYGAVKQAGGWITAVSAEGVGATFDIYLPRCLEEGTKSLTPSPLSENTCRGMILVVEDEPIVCAVAQALLSRSGYTVLTAPDGASALNALREHPTDIRIILLDMTMPGMTTDEIVQAIRALNSTVSILLNSGYTSNDAVNQMLAEHSVQGFLGKPYTLGELVGKVQELLCRS